MSKGLYYGADIEVSAQEVLNQQGLMWQTSHRESGIAASGSLDLLIDVKSSCQIDVQFSADGLFQGTFSSAASAHNHASLDKFVMNSFFQAANSGNALTEISHTSSYGTLSSRWDFFVPGNGTHKPVGRLILNPGLYVFAMQNLSGGAAAININATWDEPTVPNVP